MKIVHICMAQYSDGWTYQENLLTKYHVKLGNEVSLITSMFCYREGKLVEDSKTNFYDVNGTRIIRLEKKRNGFMGKLPTYNNFYKVLADEEPDIIFSHGCQYRDVTLVVKYVRTHPNVKLFVDNHADFTNSATSLISKCILHKLIWRYYAHRLLPYTERFWGVMPARVDFLIDVYGLPREKCDLLVMGADDELVEKSTVRIEQDELKLKYGIKESDFLVVTGGKIDKAKLQIELLMKAVAEIKNANVKLLIFGSIEDDIKDQIMRLVDNKKIIYAGWVTPDQSYVFFAIADLVVFPGRHSVFWEQAAGQGKPMICRSWPGTHHIDVGGNVKFIEKDDVESIRCIIQDIYENKKLYGDMMQACNKAKKEFSYMAIAKKSIGDIDESADGC